MTTIASWNVNSVRARIDNITAWLQTNQPDIALFQEIKAQDEQFPGEAFEDLGYNLAIHGQKSYNGVAILAKEPIHDVLTGLPGDDKDEQARYIEAEIGGIRIASIYLPNGNPPGTDSQASEKYEYKLAWMERLYKHAASLLADDIPFVLGGDYNVIPEPRDAANINAWTDDALYKRPTRQAFRRLINLGLTEAFRAVNQEDGAYTFWDYQAGAWQQDKGIRIDHFLLSPACADRLVTCTIDRAPRSEPKASDHTPIIVELGDAA
ncbi:MAG: exodeoxyribonuclease III [Pseudomonadota bacterium]